MDACPHDPAGKLCNGAAIGKYKAGECHLCHVFVNHERYKHKRPPIYPANAPRVSFATLEVRNPACGFLDWDEILDRRDETCQHRMIVKCDLLGRCVTGIEIDGIRGCQRCPYYDPAGERMPKYVRIASALCPGDNLVLTAAVRSLHMQHPGKFITQMETTTPTFWHGNVDQFEGTLPPDAITIKGDYEAIHQSDARPIHFMQAACENLEQALGVRVPLLVNRPVVNITAEERKWINQVREVHKWQGPFWILNSGHKADYTAKHWGWDNYAKLVERLRGKIMFVQVGLDHHQHRPIPGAFDLIGKTNDRQFLRLVFHASGAVGPSTLLMHAAAAFEKPYVCIAGGREPVTWQQYPRQITLHTIGQFECCRERACWKSRTVFIDDKSEHNDRLCERPMPTGIPQCLDSISVEQVASAILAYR